MIVEPAPAKLNLALHVRQRRDDGYHDLETLFAFCTDGDVVHVEPAELDTLTIDGPLGAGLSAADDNLVSRAVAAFRAATGIGAGHAIVLEKNLPVASGIGGGSADAAATLRALAGLHGVDPATLVPAAAGLGADVPACLAGRTTMGTGRGDLLADLEGLTGTPALLINPFAVVSTAAVFAAWDGIDRGALPGGTLRDRAIAARNDLTAPARLIAPVIDDVLGLLAGQAGAWLVRMSGSGATCFALFDAVADRDAADAAVAAARPGWWRLPTMLA